MSFTTRNLKQTLTHWAATPDGYGGYTFGAPSTIKCRWEERGELFRTLSGEEVVSQAVVHLKSNVQEGDYVYLGETDEEDPTTLTTAYRVRRFTRTTDIRNLNVSRVAYL